MKRIRERHEWRCRRQFQLPAFRTTFAGRCSAQHPEIKGHRKNLQTCFEGPFGELLRATGPMAKANPFRFSTKYQDDETDLLYYGKRYLNPSLARWISRDSIGERGGKNLYCFVENSSVGRVDIIGYLGINTKTRTLTLPDCELAVVYGHGDNEKGNHWKWKFSDPQCSAGAAVMCFPLANMENLVDGMRLWTSWGGLPLENPEADGGRKPWDRVYWGLPASGADWFDYLGANMPNANKAILQVRADAIARAKGICKKSKCCCKYVVVWFLEVDHAGDIMEKPAAYDGVPVIKGATISCATGAEFP